MGSGKMDGGETMLKKRLIAGVMACAVMFGFGFGTAHFVQKEDAPVTAADSKFGIVPFTLPIPSSAQGSFQLQFVNDKGISKPNSPSFVAGVSNSITIEVQGTGNEKLYVFLVNKGTGKSSQLGVYTFDFANKTYAKISEDIDGAFQSLSAFPEETTEPPIEPTQESLPDPTYEASDPTEPISPTASAVVGDLNGDGLVNASDAALILIYAAAVGAGYEGTLPEYFAK